MKKIIAISLTFVFLIVNTELHQLLKLPVLIHHYLEHHQDEQNKSFAHFLSDHYSSNPEHSDSNHDEHDNLPFKTNDCATAHVTSLAFVNHFQYAILNPNTLQVKSSPIYNGVIYFSSFHSSIWQPPKIS